ncbi:hypothetical protein ACSBR1_028935 [Camellia fascicularis]
MMDSEVKIFIKVWIASIASMCYCFFMAKHIPKGITRLFFYIPIFYLLITLPFNLHSSHLVGPTSLYLVWLANFKLLLFSFDLGPLSDSNSLLHFISTALLPIKIKQDPSPNSPPNPQTNPNPPPKSSPDVQRSAQLAKFVLVSVLAILILAYNHGEYLYSFFVLGLHWCHLYLDVLAISAILARAIQGLELEPQFNEPYLSTSLQDFWGRRSYLMIRSILRPTVYIPIRCISTRMLGRRWAPLPAIVSTFFVSGVMHEMMFFYLTRSSPTWEITWFFVFHGVCTAAEVAAKKAVGGKWQLHKVRWFPGC